MHSRLFNYAIVLIPKLILTYLRSNIGEERLSALTIMNLKADVTITINYNDVIQEFAETVHCEKHNSIFIF